MVLAFLRMIPLLLSKPNYETCKKDEPATPIVPLLDRLESVIRSVILSSGGRSEARLWLIKAISGIGSIAPRQQQELFSALLRHNPIKRRLAPQLMRLIFDKSPREAGRVLARRSYVLERFFEGNPRRVMQWFSNSNSAVVELGKGAKALSKFAFVNRDICWEELVWKGKHGQSPAMVATKPHYFLDLDIQETVDNFIEYVPEFWSSDEFAKSLRDGEILSVDTKYFIELFVDLMYKEDSGEVWDTVNEFLAGEPFSYLCHHLLIVLEEQDLSYSLELIQKHLRAASTHKDYGRSSNWLDTVLLKCDDASIDQLLLLNAVINQGRQLLLFLRDEEVEDAKEQVKNIVTEICISSSSSIANSLVPILKEWCGSKTIKVMKRLGLLSWVFHYLLSEKCHTSESWESLFISNGIKFRKSYGGLLEGRGSDSDDRASSRSRHKKKKKNRKKRRRSLDRDDSYFDELLGAEILVDKQQSSGSWLLSSDEYSTSWDSMDLPEYLSKYCLSTWMGWLCGKE